VGVELSGVPGIRHHNRLCQDKRAIKHQSFADNLYSSYVLASSILSSDGEITLPEYATATGEPGRGASTVSGWITQVGRLHGIPNL
jgi:hypothetical protein